MQLGVILLNPSLRLEETITERNIRAACHGVGYDCFEIANLTLRATRDLTELNRVTSHDGPWLSARSSLTSVISASDALLFGWGLGGFTREARAAFQCQTNWVVETAIHHGHESSWLLCGAPRHPSRWRQYIGPQKARVPGSSFESRLASALVLTPLLDQCSRSAV